MPKKNGMPTYKDLEEFVLENFAYRENSGEVTCRWIEDTDVGTPEIVALLKKKGLNNGR